MWAVELVKDRATREPFPAAYHLSSEVFRRAFDAGLIVYAMSGCADGVRGDHIMISPPLIVTETELDEIVRLLKDAVDRAIERLDR